jgi:hypothetical protein
MNDKTLEENDRPANDAGHESAPPVRVLQRTGIEIPFPNCLVVEPYRDDALGDELLATVEHFVEVENAAGGFPWRIDAVSRGTLTLSEAVNLAKAYAERKQVPVILVNHESLSSAAEKQQTDTTVLKLKPRRAQD